MYSQRPALNSFIWNIQGVMGIWAETAFFMYITRLNYITSMFYQGIMVMALENSALDLDSINPHIYFIHI